MTKTPGGSELQETICGGAAAAAWGWSEHVLQKMWKGGMTARQTQIRRRMIRFQTREGRGGVRCTVQRERAGELEQRVWDAQQLLQQSHDRHRQNLQFLLHLIHTHCSIHPVHNRPHPH
jgi:hypothetical protein